MKKRFLFVVTLFVIMLQMTVLAKTIKFVSSDVSNYPRVKLFYKVYDNSGVIIQRIKFTKVTIFEKVSGGEYLEREVKAHEQLTDGVGISTGLVADRSTSLSEADIENIKNTLKQYVDSMKLENGDEAELIGFDDLVETLCDYTNNKSKLITAINSLQRKGNTALYDAIYQSIFHSAAQKGARCVIAFTDGKNNRGTLLDGNGGVNTLINYAKEQQVPVYIVGVGSNVNTSTLTNIAEKTGGKYWNIRSLQDFYKILMEIYKIERCTYYFEYVTDVPKERVRNIRLIVNDGTETIETTDEVKPVIGTYVKKEDDSSRSGNSGIDDVNEIPSDLTYAAPGTKLNSKYGDTTYDGPTNISNVPGDFTYSDPSSNLGMAADNTFSGPDVQGAVQVDNTFAGPDQDMNLQNYVEVGPHLN